MGTSKNHLRKDADSRILKHNRVFRAGAASERSMSALPDISL